MNPRIQLLAEQADVFADQKIKMPGEYHPDWHDIRDQHFAHLLIRECGKLADLAEPFSAQDLILEYFGVPNDQH